MALKRYGNLLRPIRVVGWGMALAFFGCLQVPVQACTIFVLTNAHQALFCNNEDWSNPKTRIWFVPSGKDYYGCAYDRTGWRSLSRKTRYGNPAPVMGVTRSDLELSIWAELGLSQTPPEIRGLFTISRAGPACP